MSKWLPLEGETPESYVERVGGWEHANMKMMEILQTEFGLSRGTAKNVSLCSSSFWRSFYLQKLGEMHQRGAKRTSAVNFVQKRNESWDIGKPVLSEAEIDELLNEFGDWNE